MKQYPLALIGAGSQAKFGHLPVLKADASCMLSVVVDPSIAARQSIVNEMPSVAEYESLEAADLSEIHCAIVSSPTTLHYRQVKYLLEKNIHVFCEKPLAQKSSEAKDLAELAAKKNLVLQAGYNRRFQPVTQFIIESLSLQRYGRLNSVTIRAGSVAKDLPPSILNPALSGGGILMDYAVHFMDRLCSWFPQLEITSYEDDSRGGAEANALIKFNAATALQKNILVTLMISWTTDLGDTIRLDFENVAITLTINNATQYSLLPRNRNSPFPKKYYYDHRVAQLTREAVDIKMLQWQEFIARMNGAPEKHSSLNDAIRTTALAEACYSKRKLLELSWGL